MSESNVAQFSVNVYDTVFISDLHLGAQGCQAEALLEFLQSTPCNNLIMVGDIIDGWQLKSRIYWPDSHINVVREILRKSRTGTNVVYVTGNHDEFLRNYSGIELGNIQLVDEYHFKAKTGEDYLVIHGDQFDVVTLYARWIAGIGDIGYNLLLKLNTSLNKVRARLGYGYWSLAKWAKDSVKQAVSFIGDFEVAVAQECERRGFDGVICGHIHKAVEKKIGDVTYYNCGDWVESCTAILHKQNGEFEIVNYFDHKLAQPEIMPEPLHDQDHDRKNAA